MDEQFFMYCEEVDWCYRFKQAGWKIMFTPHPEIIHIHGASTRQARVEMVLQSWKSILLFMYKHKGYGTYLIACLLLICNFIPRVLYWSVKIIFSKSERHVCVQMARAYGTGITRLLLGSRKLCLGKTSEKQV
jgi:GT2 family glycosyltransferase